MSNSHGYCKEQKEVYCKTSVLGLSRTELLGQKCSMLWQFSKNFRKNGITVCNARSRIHLEKEGLTTKETRTHPTRHKFNLCIT